MDNGRWESLSSIFFVWLKTSCSKLFIITSYHWWQINIVPQQSINAYVETQTNLQSYMLLNPRFKTHTQAHTNTNKRTQTHTSTRTHTQAHTSMHTHTLLLDENCESLKSLHFSNLTWMESFTGSVEFCLVCLIKWPTSTSKVCARYKKTSRSKTFSRKTFPQAVLSLNPSWSYPL